MISWDNHVLTMRTYMTINVGFVCVIQSAVYHPNGHFDGEKL